MAVLRGRLRPGAGRFGIIVSRFNQFITRRLLESAVETLQQAGVPQKSIDIVWVPGALEVPFFCKRLAEKKKFRALLALACVLRGGTRHFECVSQEITRGISQVALEKGIPIATGVITADTLEEAVDRAGLKSGNKGAQAALAALEIADLSEQLNRPQTTDTRQQRKKDNKR